ncbi:MAG TPA: glycoside hydrolase family 44 protein, partial [Myxococcaceae bacterium]
MTKRALTWLGAGVLLLSTASGRAWSEESRKEGQEEASGPQSAVPGFAVNLLVNAQQNVRPISPEIYGVSSATAAQLADLNVPLHRRGGNHTTRYNWQLNATSRANDWYFQSTPEGDGTPGGAVDAFIADSRSAGAQPMITMPTLGWVAKLGAGREKLASFSIAKYGPQLDFDEEWFPDAGNGIQMTGAALTGNDPTDANMPSDPAFQQGWVRHLVNRWGTAAQGGTRYYLLDNEPSLWHSTHRDVHPTGATMEQVRDRMIAYGAAVKAVDPGAQLVGPEEWGWSGYFYSGYDQQYFQSNNSPPPSSLPDRAAHGQWDYVPWLLDQLRQEAARTGRRTLDVLSVHYYPQGGEYSDDISTEQQLRRNRSTRAMWD